MEANLTSLIIMFRKGIVMRGLKREIVSDDTIEDHKLGDELADVRLHYRSDDFDDVEAWVKERWQGVEKRQTAREKEASARAIAAKKGQRQ